MKMAHGEYANKGVFSVMAQKGFKISIEELDSWDDFFKKRPEPVIAPAGPGMRELRIAEAEIPPLPEKPASNPIVNIDPPTPTNTPIGLEHEWVEPPKATILPALYHGVVGGTGDAVATGLDILNSMRKITPKSDNAIRGNLLNQNPGLTNRDITEEINSQHDKFRSRPEEEQYIYDWATKIRDEHAVKAQPYSGEWWASGIGGLVPSAASLAMTSAVALRSGNFDSLRKMAVASATKAGASYNVAKILGEFAAGGGLGWYMSIPEAEMEAQKAYADEIRRGATPEQAEVVKKRVRDINLVTLATSNTLENVLSLGKLPFKGAKAEVARTAMNMGQNAGEEAIQQAAPDIAANRPVNMDEVTQSAAMGAAGGLLFSGAGKLLRMSAGRTNVISNWNNAVAVLRDPAANPEQKDAAKETIRNMATENGLDPDAIDFDRVPTLDDAKLNAIQGKQTTNTVTEQPPVQTPTSGVAATKESLYPGAELTFGAGAESVTFYVKKVTPSGVALSIEPDGSGPLMSMSFDKIKERGAFIANPAQQSVPVGHETLDRPYTREDLIQPTKGEIESNLTVSMLQGADDVFGGIAPTKESLAVGSVVSQVVPSPNGDPIIKQWTVMRNNGKMVALKDENGKLSGKEIAKMKSPVWTMKDQSADRRYTEADLIPATRQEVAHSLVQGLNQIAQGKWNDAEQTHNPAAKQELASRLVNGINKVAAGKWDDAERAAKNENVPINIQQKEQDTVANDLTKVAPAPVTTNKPAPINGNVRNHEQKPSEEIKIGDTVTSPGKNDGFVVMDDYDPSMFVVKTKQGNTLKTGKKGVVKSGSAADVATVDPNQKQKDAFAVAYRSFEEASKLSEQAKTDSSIENPWPEVIELLKETLHAQNVSDARIDEQSRKMIREAEKASAAFGEDAGTIETENSDKKSGGTHVGAKSTATTERGTKIDTRFEIVSADDLVASHDTDLSVNKNYPQELQPRDRSRVASKDQVSKMSKTIKPELLGESPKASDGAPIVGPDNVVESGNGRTIALKKAIQEGSSTEYTDWLKENAEKFGIDRNDITDKSILVRRRTSDVDRAKFVAEANESSVARMSDTEQAMTDARKISSELLGLFLPNDNGEINTAANRGFITRFMQEVVGPTESGSFMASDGSISQSGINRIRNAVFAKAYGDASLLAKLVESTDNNIKNITNAMLMAAPKVAAVKQRIESGELFHLDISSEMAEATQIISHLKETGQPLDNYLQQGNMFGEDVSPITKSILEVFDKYKRSGKQIARVFQAYYDGVVEAGNPNQTTLFEQESPSRESLLNSSERKGIEANADEPAGQSLFASGPETPGTTHSTASNAEDRRNDGQGDRKATSGRTGQESEIDQKRTAENGGSSVLAGRGVPVDSASRYDFVSAPDRTYGFGEISVADASKLTEASGKKFAPGQIRIRVGWHDDAKGTGAGYRHIVAREDQIKKAGFKDAYSFILDVASGFTEVRENENDRLLLVKAGPINQVASVELEKEADGIYVVVTAMPVSAKKNYLQNKRLLLERNPGRSPHADQGINLEHPSLDVGEKESTGAFDRSNPSTQTIQQTKEKNNGKPEKAGSIGDFGAKIGGAKKDIYTSYKDDLTKAQGVDVSAEPLSKSWPQPDYESLIESGVDSWIVAFIRAARDEVPQKPRNSYRITSWVSQVKVLRDFATKLIEGNIDKDTVKSRAKEVRSLQAVLDRAELYETVGHGHSLAGVSIRAGHYSMYYGERYNPPKVIWEVSHDVKATALSNMPKKLGKGDTRQEAIDDFKKNYAEFVKTDTPKAQTTFEIYSERGKDGFFIGKKVGRNVLHLEGPFAKASEARSYKDLNTDKLIEKLEKIKETPSERRDKNNPRVGEDMRNGADVTPEMFSDAFGFYGVEFGNWVEQDKRQESLNEAYDALMDMAAILNIPPKAISLNGELGLAFGARGSGGKNPFAAHYESNFVVINLTKKKGAGSLGHEWWHAMDNYFSRMRNNPGGMMTESIDAKLYSIGMGEDVEKHSAPSPIRKEMTKAFGEVIRAINKTAMAARSKKLDKKRTKDYWTTGREMAARAFESYLITKLQDQNASNDYLANIVDESTWDAMAALGIEIEQSYPYPTAAEIPAIRAAFDHFFQTIESEQTDKGVRLYSGLDPFQLIPGLRKYSDMTAKEAFNDLVAIGRKVFEETTHGGKWMARMKELLGDMWGKAKSVMVKVWNEVKRVVKDNTGSVHIGKFIPAPAGTPHIAVAKMTPKMLQENWVQQWANHYWKSVGAKSPFFRAWFGDWRQNEKTSVPVVKITGTEVVKTANIKTAGIQMGAWVKNNLKGEVVNTDTGWQLEVANKIIDETTHYAMEHDDLPTIQSVVAIRDIVANAILHSTETNKHDNTQVPFVHVMYAPLNIGPSQYVAELRVRETRSGAKPYYLEAIKIKASTPQRGGAASALVQSSAVSQPQGLARGQNNLSNSRGSTITVAELLRHVNNPGYKTPSAIVDEDGNPLKVYHGTNEFFEAFDESMLGKNSGNGTGTAYGFFFAKDKEHADYWANNAARNNGSDPVTIDVFLDIKTPLRVKDPGDGGLTVDRKIKEAFTNDYDGVIIENAFDDDSGDAKTMYVVFSPEQVKSVDNAGSFNKGNDNIFYSFPANISHIIPGLSKYNDLTVTEAFRDLVKIGTAAYESGITNGGKWMQKMREVLGSAWTKAKPVMMKVWNEVKKAVSNNRGSIAGDIGSRIKNNISEKLNLKAAGVEIKSAPPDKSVMGILDSERSARMVAEKHPAFKPFYNLGTKAIETQERLRAGYRKELNEIDKLVSDKKNKETLYSILIAGDAQGKNFTEEELQGVDAKVIEAYRRIRALYDDAWQRSNEVKKARIASGEVDDPLFDNEPIGYRKGYIPHFWHNWVVIVDGVPVVSATKIQDAVKFAKAFQGGGNVVIQPRQAKFEGENTLSALFGDFAHAKIVEKMANSYSITTREAEELAVEIAKQSKSYRFVGNFLERKGAAGWTTDLDYVNAHYFNMVSRFIALDEFKGKAWGLFERLYGDRNRRYPGGTVKAFTQDYINDVNGAPVDVETMLNEWIKQTPGLYKFLGAYLPDRPSLQIASATTKAMAVAKLGFFNASAGLVQVNQLLGINAKLGGGAAAYAGLGKWARLGAYHAMRPNAKDKQILDEVGVDFDIALDSGSGYSKAGNISKLMEFSLYAFRKSDIFLRRTAALGAYAKGISEGMSHDDAIQYAKDTNQTTNFDYSVANTPNFLRRSGPLGQVFLQFKKYPVMQTEFIFSLKGAEHARYWIPILLISGLYGFPFSDLILSIIKGITGEDWELKGKKMLYKWAGNDQTKQVLVDMALGGVPRAVLKIDAARRIGMSDLIPNELSDLTGPALSTVYRLFQQANREKLATVWPEMLRTISPGLGNPVIAYTGEKLGRRGRKQETYEFPETVVKMLGFMPVKESVNNDIRRIVQQDIKGRQGEEYKAIDDYIYDPSPETKRRLDELKISMKRVKAEIERKNMTATDRAKAMIPKKLRDEYDGMIEFEKEKKKRFF